MTDREREKIIEIWKDLSPKDAFMAGFDETAGSMFLPIPENVESMRSDLDRLWGGTRDLMERSFIRWARFSLEFREPQMGPEDILWGLFGHILKEGMVPSHLASLLKTGKSILDMDLANFSGTEQPVEIRIIIQNTIEGIRTILRNIGSHRELDECIEDLSPSLDEFERTFQVSNMAGSDYRSVKSILEMESGSMGREKIYPRILREMYGMVETPQQIEERALLWLYSEIPLLKRSCLDLSHRYGIDPDVASIGKVIEMKRAVDPAEMYSSLEELREVLHPFVNREIVEITPKYDTRIMETPPYLSPFIPTGSVSSFNGFTDSPFNVIFISKDPKRTPPLSLPDLFLVLIHEEFGHCVNFSNSFGRFGSKPADVELLTTPMMLPISDGMSIHREWEMFSRILEMVRKSPEDMGPEERALHDLIDGRYPFMEFVEDLEYMVRKWRVLRYLRAVADIRINLGKQTLLEFIHWAHITTGLPESMIFDQVFIYMGMPGYAPAFVVSGERIREIQEIKLNHGISRRAFNKYASSMGFPGRKIFESRLAEF